MRAGLLSKAVSHITLLIEDWFTGVRPRHLVVPCPHCTSDQPHKEIPLERSFSMCDELVPEFERSVTEADERSSTRLDPANSFCKSPQTSPRVGRRVAQTQLSPQLRHRSAAPRHKLSQEVYYYAFRYDDCVVMARSLDGMFCPAHGNIPLQYMAPDTVSSSCLILLCFCLIRTLAWSLDRFELPKI